MAEELTALETRSNTKPTFNMTFHNEEKTVGTLDWSDGVLKFTGDAEGSAKLLFEFLKPLMDHYLKGRES